MARRPVAAGSARVWHGAVMATPVPEARAVPLRATAEPPEPVAEPTGQRAEPVGGPAAPTAARVAGLLAGWAALSVGIAAKDGRYGGYAMAAVLIGWAVVAATVALLAGNGSAASVLGRPVRLAARRLGRPTPWLSWQVTWVAVALLVGLGPPLRHPHYYGHGAFVGVAKWLQITAGLLAAVGVLAALARPSRPASPAAAWVWAALRGRRAFTAVLLLATGAGIATVLAAPDPQIDVFHLLQESSAGLGDGVNMYHQVWATGRPGDLHGGLTDVYPYLPATSILLAPFRLLFGDVRYGLLAALVVAVCAARALAPRAASAPWMPVLPLLVLIFPSYCYSLEQSWTEPLLVGCLAVMMWAVCSGRGLLAVVAFAVALATKQHVALLVPVAAVWPAFGPRRTAAACGLGFAIVAPWVLDDPAAFFHDAVRANLDYPVLDHSLSVPGWADHYGIHVGFGVTAVALAVAYLLAWRARGDATGFAAGGALVLLTVVELNKQSFFNHYTLPMALLILATATTLGPGDDPARTSASLVRQRTAHPLEATATQDQTP
ncbi:glycosyltransferase [Frankia sp. AgB1.9]|nr:glycosyltransferase [Frankia sp. AgW1.1]MBL7552954.1 glycosyltransferase [Frankia sp. AgB1.9]MBL7618283.1 glycosyltransferase [Frankia sp. AgB1.8]